MIRGAAFFSCLLLAACDGGNDDVSSNKAVPSTRVSAERKAMTPEELASARRRELMAEAMRDRELREMQAEVERLLEESPEGSPYARRLVSKVVSLYASRFPEAGLEWIDTLKDTRMRKRALDWFIFELNLRNPDQAFELLDKVPEEKMRSQYLSVLCLRVAGQNIERARAMLDGGWASREARVNLMKAEARENPMAAWERAQKEMGPEMGAYDFIQSMDTLNTGVEFPMVLLDQIKPGKSLEKAVESAVRLSWDGWNVQPIEQWLENPPEGDYQSSYLKLLTYHLYNTPDGEVRARKWAERLTDPAKIERAREQFEKAEARK